MKRSEEQLQAAIDAYHQHGCSERSAAAAIGIPKSTFHDHLRAAMDAGLEPACAGLPSPLPGMHVERVSELRRTPDGSLVWLKQKRSAEDILSVIERTAERFAERIRPIADIRPPAVVSELLAAYVFGDPHLGMRAWGKECGNDWDTDISRGVHTSAIDALVTTGRPARDALIVNVGDYFHHDSNANATPRSGHVLDVDSRLDKVIEVGVEVEAHMVYRALEMHESVTVINVKGNHDPHVSVALNQAMKMLFRDNPRVTIRGMASKFTYHEWHNCLFGATHGDSVKLDRLPMLMAVDQREAWGRTRWGYWFTGHVHHRQVMRTKDVDTVMVESFPTLAAQDSYASGGGYRSLREATKILFHPEWGELDRHVAKAEMFCA